MFFRRKASEKTHPGSLLCSPGEKSVFLREEASGKPHGVCFLEGKQEKNHKQKIPHFIHSHLEAKGNRWYNLKDCMKTNPRQLKKSFSGTGSAIKRITQKVAFSVVSESDCRKKYFKENLLCTRSLRWNLPEEPCVSM